MAMTGKWPTYWDGRLAFTAQGNMISRYPLGFDCANPYTWPDNALPTDWLSSHLSQSPSTPYSISEFQGGSFDPWGGQGFANCTILLNEEFERVFYKNNYAIGVTIFNIYMACLYPGRLFLC
jgi:hypothetical protein